MKKQVTTKIVLETRFPRKNGTFPIKLRVTFNRKRKYYATGQAMTEEDFAKVTGKTDCNSRKERQHFNEIRIGLNGIEQHANDVIKKLDSFSYPGFERGFIDNAGNPKDVFKAYEAYMKVLKKDGHVGTHSTYQTSMNSLKAFSKRKKIYFSEITPDWLKKYEKWMLAQGKSLTTVSIYVRTLRTLFNEAIQKKHIPRDCYPFGKHQYRVHNKTNVKKALPTAEIKKIFEYKPLPGSKEQFAHDMWIFSYLCNGANMKDIARLRNKNIDGEKIVFIRAKTENTTRHNQKPIVGTLTENVQKIIDRWGNQYRESYDFVFPILELDMDPENEMKRVKQTTKTINKYLKRIGTELGISRKLTTMTARHCAATMLMKKGAATAFISDWLGHKNTRTTENYLDSFEEDTKKEWAAALTDF